MFWSTSFCFAHVCVLRVVVTEAGFNVRKIVGVTNFITEIDMQSESVLCSVKVR